MAFARRFAVDAIAYRAAVMAGALLTVASFQAAFRAVNLDFLTFAGAGIFVLSLPAALLVLPARDRHRCGFQERCWSGPSTALSVPPFLSLWPHLSPR